MNERFHPLIAYLTINSTLLVESKGNPAFHCRLTMFGIKLSEVLTGPPRRFFLWLWQATVALTKSTVDIGYHFAYDVSGNAPGRQGMKRHR